MSIPAPGNPHKPKFLEEVRQALRVRHYSIRTERTYLDWIRQFILLHGKRHPKRNPIDQSDRSDRTDPTDAGGRPKEPGTLYSLQSAFPYPRGDRIEGQMRHYLWKAVEQPNMP